MKISSQTGNFKIIQTIKNRDELLVLGSWRDLIKVFASQRIFLVNKKESLFGLYLCKQECADFVYQIIQEINYCEWDAINLDTNEPPHHYRAMG
ncbi:hypothetical protein PBT90_00665 [Algoriphagus halophytocola]|uniref:Uncharacterized protein n=1 Tax=Algoriphagus halophytocola TaxID=2991499 RepID=A0ABY6MIF5_9BACT|nr:MULTISPECIES: hypothetical protein [unclassified Algoriphagus]UZD21969.1 hypothetical protein OM944_14990 [Algoriphagus sp. TR-M5]WBL43220.1 hypothetical protein PBT90_00665 [Algoriphagus sp. TR-M9]